MSDLDENLTSILSSLIDTDGIEAPNASELPDNSSFNDSQLDFDNLANCITGNDASLHQTSDENVSSLLESHLNNLSQTDNTDIVESATENLDDVTPFDLDKPIESLLETNSTEFITQECSETHVSIGEKTLHSQIISTNSSSTSNITEDILEDAQSNSDGIDNIINETCPSNMNLPYSESFNAETNETQTLNELDVTETNGQTPEIVESNSDAENQGVDQSCVEDEGLGAWEPCETITADAITDELLTNASISKHKVKKRRRILVYNDAESDGDSEVNEERERILQSKSPTSSHHSDELEEDDKQNEQLNDEHSNPSNDDHDIMDDDYVRDPNEKPGPKSKKQSTHLFNALKAKALLESAIVIPARKKKKRVIDSDDEHNDSALNQPIASVDDIGLIPEDNNIQMPFNVSIEIEQQSSIVYVKKEDEIDLKPVISKLSLNENELDGEQTNVDVVVHEPAFVKVEPLNRTTTQSKMEKHNVNNNRRFHKKKEPKDVFGISLNAPYVDSSSDDDYFPANTTSSRRHQHNHNHTQHWGSKIYSANQRKKKGHIPDDVYFNAKVPLHILYSYDDTSSDDDEKNVFPITHSVQSQKTSIQPTNRTLNKMPPVHKIISRRITHGKSSVHKVIPKHPSRPVKSSQPASKPTVFEQLDKLKRFLRASGIKINVNELLKGSKTFQERCERIRNVLHCSGIEGEPTMAKCKKLKKQLKLKEEIAGLDLNMIIESKEDEGHPKRSTRRATRRNYLFDEPLEMKNQQQQQQPPEIKEDASQLLQKIKEFIDSDSEYDGDEHNLNSNNVDPANTVEAIISSNDANALPEQILSTATQSTQELNPIQTVVAVSPMTAQCKTTVPL